MQIAYKPIRNLIILIAAASLVYYGFRKWDKWLDRTIKHSYIQFNESEIKGKLEWTTVKYHMISFKLQGRPTEYLIDPNVDIDGHIFDLTAKPGYSIIKAPYSDTLTLKKVSKKHEFTF